MSKKDIDKNRLYPAPVVVWAKGPNRAFRRNRKPIPGEKDPDYTKKVLFGIYNKKEKAHMKWPWDRSALPLIYQLKSAHGALLAGRLK